MKIEKIIVKIKLSDGRSIERETEKTVLEKVEDANTFYEGRLDPVEGKRSLIKDANYAIDLMTRAAFRQAVKTAEEKGPDYQAVKMATQLVAMGALDERGNAFTQESAVEHVKSLLPAA
jgi:hypothetical protein